MFSFQEKKYQGNKSNTEHITVAVIQLHKESFDENFQHLSKENIWPVELYFHVVHWMADHAVH